MDGIEKRGKGNTQAVITFIASILVEVIPYVKTSIVIGSILEVDEIEFSWIYTTEMRLSKIADSSVDKNSHEELI